MDSLALLVSLVIYRQMKAENYIYDYDVDIHADEETVKNYKDITRKWDGV